MKYNFEDYNEYNVLKIPLIVILINIYLLKHILIFILPMISTIPFLVKFAHQQFSIVFILSSIPAVLVIISMLKRVPKTRSFVIRWIWKQGRFLLLLNLVLEISLIVLYVLLDFKKFDEISLMFLYIDVALITIFVKSQRMRDVFAEFPEPVQS